jgi:DNA replication protein DnaC
MPSTWRKWERS